MNKRMDWARVATFFGGSLAACIPAAIAEPAFGPAQVGSTHSASREPEETMDLLPLPETVRITRHLSRAVGSRSHLATAAPRTLIYSASQGTRYYAPGANYRIADDCHTAAVDGSDMNAFVVRVTGGVPSGTGEFTCLVSLWTACPTGGDGQLIPGTERLFEHLVDNLADLHDLVVDVSDLPIPIPPTVWVRVQFDTRMAGWVLDAPAETGYSSDQFDHSLFGCNSWFGGWGVGSRPHATFYVQIYAANEPALEFTAFEARRPSESFEVTNGEYAYLRLAVSDCEIASLLVDFRGTVGPFTAAFSFNSPYSVPIPGTQRQYHSIRGNGAIESVRFDFPAGIIIPDPVWLQWEVDKPNTGVLAAGDASIGCGLAYYWECFGPTPQCFSWPAPLPRLLITCRGAPQTFPTCPRGDVAWRDPVDGVVDARQPHAVNDSTQRMGIDRIVVSAPTGADERCWTLCDSAAGTERNGVTGATEFEPGSYVLDLHAPIASGAVTRITYLFDESCRPVTAEFTTHPGNVNADSVANARDIKFLIDCCLNRSCAPHGLYSCDMDHSGTVDPKDLTRLIDLLNGAGAFDPWVNTRLPQGPCREVCGGFIGIPCDSGEFCKLPLGTCDTADLFGRCVAVGGGCPDIWEPVCGCDGQTYSNECDADAAGVQIDFRGECAP